MKVQKVFLVINETFIQSLLILWNYILWSFQKNNLPHAEIFCLGSPLQQVT